MVLNVIKLLLASIRWGKLSQDEIRIIKTTSLREQFTTPLIQSKMSPKHQTLEQYTVVLRTKAP